MKWFECAIATIALGFAGFVCATPQYEPSNPVASQASSGSGQLQRMLVDYRLAEILSHSFAIGQDAIKDSPVRDVFEHINTVQEPELARAMVPALRDCVTEDEARRVADFLETNTGHTIMDYTIANLADPQHSLPKPKLDPRAMQSFQANGALAAMHKFGACLQAPDRRRRATIALVHYLTRPEINPGT